MEIKFYGANCVKLITKQRTIVIDDNLSELGLKAATKETDSLFYTSKGVKPAKTPVAQFLNDSPGEFELGNLMVQGYAVRGVNDEADQKTAIVYTFTVDRITAVVIGHVHPSVDTDFLESLADADVAVIPVGNNDLTLDAANAVKIGNKLNPNYLVPTHYADKDVNYPSDQDPITKFIEEMKQEAETLDSLKLKAGAPFDASSLHLVLLNRQS